MSDMIDKVSKAIHRAMPGRENSFVEQTPLTRLLARAAIEAMREPTEAMENAGDETFDWTSSDSNGNWYPQRADATECWIAMIDAAISEQNG